MENNSHVSPISKTPVTLQIGDDSAITRYRHLHSATDEISRIAYSENILKLVQQKNVQYPGLPNLTEQESRKFWCLFRSLAWRLNIQEPNKTLCLHMQDDLVEDGKASSASHVGSHKFVDYEYLVSEAKRLTIRQMAVETLVNLFTIYEKDGKFPPIKYAIHDLSAPRNVVFQIDESKHDIVERGQAYGCDERSAKLVYSYLYDEDLISFRPKGSALSWSITSKGLSIIDELQKGKSAFVKRCFVVRKFDHSLDQLLNSVFSQVEEALKIEVRPVWAEYHNDKLDERIFKSIEESSVVLVDVDPTRYNVGLEHGYAMGLGKPVIIMMQEDRYPGNRGKNLGINVRSLPFDICTQNCALYTREKVESGELAKILSARISIALNSCRS